MFNENDKKVKKKTYIEKQSSSSRFSSSKLCWNNKNIHVPVFTGTKIGVRWFNLIRF